MEMRVITEQDMNTTKWSGGKTTEMLIYPQNSSYIERNFQFRISSATVEEESSVFTELPGIERHLVVLDGKIDLCIDNQEVHLAPFDSIVFRGGDKTSSKGKCVDFNLMLNGCRGNLDVFNIEGTLRLGIASNEMCVFYTYETDLKVKQDTEVLSVPPKGLLLVENKERGVETITLNAKKGTRLICVKIQL